jgi:hypothetical protein
VTSDGSPYGRFRRAIDRGNLTLAEAAARELPTLNLADALDYCDLLAREAPERYERAALRWARPLAAGREDRLTSGRAVRACVSGDAAGRRQGDGTGGPARVREALTVTAVLSLQPFGVPCQF